MKKILVLLTLLFAFSTQAQMTVTKLDGTPITDGQLISFNSLDINTATLGFHVHNNSASPINVRIRCESFTNCDGSGMELCFGPSCIDGLSAGHSYPSSVVVIPANGTNGDYDHFWNSNTTGSDGIHPIDYLFTFYQLDTNGDEVGNAISFTYRYTTALSNQDFSSNLQNLGVVLKSNIIDNTIDLTTTKNNEMELYDLNGKTIANYKLVSGDHSIDASNLSIGVYILNFISEDGKRASAKISKK